MKVPIHDKVGIFPKYLRRNAILCPKWKFALTRNETRYVANGINSSNGIRFCKVSFLHRWTKFVRRFTFFNKRGILFRVIFERQWTRVRSCDSSTFIRCTPISSFGSFRPFFKIFEIFEKFEKF